ncbi:MAG: uroporphyrinogen decarboxylase family protein [Christensenellaceae bacterium]
MTSRERIICALNHKEADRVPIAFGGVHDSIHRDGEKALAAFYKFDYYETKIQDCFQQIVFPDKRLLDRFHSDVLPIHTKPRTGYSLDIVDEGKYTTYYDQLGTKLRCPKDHGLYYDFEKCVLEDYTYEQLEKWQMPDPNDEARLKNLKEEVQYLYEHTDKALVLYSPIWGIFEQIYALRSIQVMYMDLAADIKAIECIAQKVLDWYLIFWPLCLKEIGKYVQVVQIGDDLGSQTGPLFNPKTYRDIFKWRHRELVDCIKANTDAKVYYHGCGSMYEFIPDLIDVGVDILNPVQIQAKNMDSAKLKREFGKDLVFWGGGANPVIMSQGSTSDVQQETKKRVLDFKTNGGFVFASIHNIQSDVSPQNVQTFFDTCLKYGNY